MHIIFSKNKLRVNVDIKKSLATVPLTHVWTWSVIGRVAAITAGITLDAIVLFLMLRRPKMNVDILSITASVLVTRILWQFILVKKTDIHVLIHFLVDTPFFMEDLKPKEYEILKIFSALVIIVMVGLWIIPIIVKFI